MGEYAVDARLGAAAGGCVVLVSAFNDEPIPINRGAP